MNTFAALMIIVACPSSQDACVEKPVTVISYDRSADCKAALPEQIRRVKLFVDGVYADCIPVSPELLAESGKIHQLVKPSDYAGLTVAAPAGEMQATAMLSERRQTVPVPRDRYASK
ncbi:MAG: hypothetical protein ACOH2J_09030 [Allorhizobium sp.]